MDGFAVQLFCLVVVFFFCILSLLPSTVTNLKQQEKKCSDFRPMSERALLHSVLVFFLLLLAHALESIHLQHTDLPIANTEVATEEKRKLNKKERLHYCTLDSTHKTHIPYNK